jgi:C4-dicarboxylate transporter, DctM subunit
MDFSVATNLVLMLAALFVLLAMGTWINFALYGVALFSLMFLAETDMSGILSSLLFNSINSYPLVALPLFIFMGELLIKSGSSAPLFRGVQKVTGPFPGGMLHANIISCSIFAACSGSSTATTIAIGGVSYPELTSKGYDRRITLGSIAAGGSLGILIPPSIMMIIFGSITQNSVGRLFIGGIIPGLLLAALFMLWIAIASVIRPKWMPPREKFGREYFRTVFSSLRELWPVILLILLIMVSIYGGFATPTEAAAVAAVVALLLVGLVYRKLTFQVIIDALKATVFLTSMMMICVVGARALGMSLSMLQVPTYLSQFVATLEISRYMIWGMLVLIYVMLGCLIDGFDLMLVTTPVFYPIVTKTLGFDPIWFGVTLVVLLEMSLITPPVGLNLFVTHSIGGGLRLQETIIGILPFLVVMLICIAILTAFPGLVTYLPSLMNR